MRLRNQRSVLPTIAHGTTGTPDDAAKAAAPSSNSSSSASRKPMRPSAKMPSTPSASKTRRTARTALVRVVLSGLYGITPPKKAITRFLKPRLKSASFGPNQVMRGSSGTAAGHESGSKPLWWLATSWNGGSGQCSRPVDPDLEQGPDERPVEPPHDPIARRDLDMQLARLRRPLRIRRTHAATIDAVAGIVLVLAPARVHASQRQRRDRDEHGGDAHRHTSDRRRRRSSAETRSWMGPATMMKTGPAMAVPALRMPM